MNTPLIEQIGLQPLKDKLKSMGGWPVLEVTIKKVLFLSTTKFRAKIVNIIEIQ